MHLLLQHRSPPITPITLGGAQTTRGHGHVVHTLWAYGDGQGGGGTHDALATRGLSLGKGKLKVDMRPHWRSDPQVDILQPNSCRFPHCQYGVSAWTHLVNDEGHCPPLCGPDTEQ